jgi:hypothetical protein
MTCISREHKEIKASWPGIMLGIFQCESAFEGREAFELNYTEVPSLAE